MATGAAPALCGMLVVVATVCRFSDRPHPGSSVGLTYADFGLEADLHHTKGLRVRRA